ncbi:MAG: hypothetical protein WCT28_03180 [Patescibacteria group bacterium]|jgi:hypothetical protein
MNLDKNIAKQLLENSIFSKYLDATIFELRRGTERLDRLVDLGVFPGMSDGVTVLHGGAYQLRHIQLLARSFAHLPSKSVYLCALTGTSRTIWDDSKSSESEATVNWICSESQNQSVTRETFLLDPCATNTGTEVRMMRKIPHLSCWALCSKWHGRRVALTWQLLAPEFTMRIVRVHSREDDLISIDDIEPVLREARKNLVYADRGLHADVPKEERDVYSAMFDCLRERFPSAFSWLLMEIPDSAQ